MLIVVLLALGAAPCPQDASAAPSWQRARALAPGEARAAALLEALPAAPEAELRTRDKQGEGVLPGMYELGLDELQNQTRAYHADLVVRLAAALHARAHAVLYEAAAAEPDGPSRTDLYERLGLASLGAGEVRLARRELGAALARGSTNAEVVLGLIALRDGRRDPARALFRGVIEAEAQRAARGLPVVEMGQSWAHRGWGLSMLPRAPSATPGDRDQP